MYLKQGINLGGREFTIETGRIAKQADGAVLVSQGETVVLVTAVSDRKPKVGAGFFPLTVDYREYGYAAGRIPGGYFKREGRPTEKEILTSRLTDRPIRPLFPEGYEHETQVISMVMSADDQNEPDVLSITVPVERCDFNETFTIGFDHLTTDHFFQYLDVKRHMRNLCRERGALPANGNRSLRCRDRFERLKQSRVLIKVNSHGAFKGLGHKIQKIFSKIFRH